MSGMNLQEVVAFLYYLITFSDILEQHDKLLMKVLYCIAEYGLKLSPSKCTFFQKSVVCLGYRISEVGMCPDPKKISAITDWPTPKNFREVRSFLGFTGCRRFVENYSSFARPLNDLLVGDDSISKKSASLGTKTRQSLGDQLAADCQKAFECIKQRLITARVGICRLGTPLYITYRCH